MSWQEFWNGDTPIYVNDVHKEVHYRIVAADLVASLDRESARVLDYGCGEAIHADAVAKTCDLLVLCDGSAMTRGRLAARFGNSARIRIAAPEQVETLPTSSFDIIVVNSVVQYLSQPEFERLLGAWHRLLAPDGRLILGDIIPRTVGPVTDVVALLRLARKHRFLTAAGLGLAKTLFSPYRTKRTEIGLLRFDEDELIELLARHGFEAYRRPVNIGHNPSRLTAIATPRLQHTGEMPRPHSLVMEQGAGLPVHSQP